MNSKPQNTQLLDKRSTFQNVPTGLRLVKLRGEAMQEAAEAYPQKMISLAGLKKEVVEGLCAECRSGDEVCQIANILFPNGFSCAGSKAAMEKLLEKANKTDGCLQAPKRNWGCTTV